VTLVPLMRLGFVIEVAQSAALIKMIVNLLCIIRRCGNHCKYPPPNFDLVWSCSQAKVSDGFDW